MVSHSHPTISAERGETPPAVELDDLWQALEQLGGDSNYLLAALTNHIRALTPVRPSGLSAEQTEYLISSGAFTAESLAETQARVARGDLQQNMFESFLSHLHETATLDDLIGYLRWDEGTIRTAVDEGRLHAIEVAGQLRFPVWQLTYRGDKLLPGLPAILEAARTRMKSLALASFMTIPQESLIATGRQVPTEWLIQGNDVQEVVDVIINSGRT
ncbi:MAG TPA: hypothetical protein VNJ54_17895 [Plantibacter sp.]|uniref:hypothetical protein n=1 Tax=unclassified Plantibacter TaxID=2624265 RepID=UPI002B529F2D|nr:hypothetical protein [Plantibacter sp.]